MLPLPSCWCYCGPMRIFSSCLCIVCETKPHGMPQLIFVFLCGKDLQMDFPSWLCDEPESTSRQIATELLTIPQYQLAATAPKASMHAHELRKKWLNLLTKALILNWCLKKCCRQSIFYVTLRQSSNSLQVWENKHAWSSWQFLKSRESF